MYKKIYLVALVVALAFVLVVAGYLFWQNSSFANEVKFTGVIQSVSDESSNDGAITIEVNNKSIDIGGGLRVAGTQFGTVSGIDFGNLQSNVGKTVEVFAQYSNPSDHQYLTIVGSHRYYVTVLQTQKAQP